MSRGAVQSGLLLVTNLELSDDVDENPSIEHGLAVDRGDDVLDFGER